MQLLIYILVYPILWLISILPFRLLYVLSDGFYILFYYIIGYRKTVVTSNLKLVFPEKSEKEILRIRKKFYHHLCDVFMEMIKTMSISRKELSKRYFIRNPEEFKRLESLNKSLILISGHYASWEWAFEIQNYTDHIGLAVYKPLANKYFDRLAKKTRSRFKTSLISNKNIISKITELEEQNKRNITGFLSDQSPKLKKQVYWGSFMGIEIPCFTGAERIAKQLDLSMAYLKVNKVKRGHYEVDIITLAEDALKYPDYELTDIFLRHLEKQIYEQPEYYFWTHKRWKHRTKNPNK